jgi:photosystem II stability/assembly factor-like uncharacterized protein
MWKLTPAIIVLAVASAAADEPLLQWQVQKSPVEVSLRGLSVVNDEVAWASGAAGTVVRTVDAGRTWEWVKVPGAEELDFRDIEAMGEQEAVVLSAGSPARAYRTDDGGKTWKIVFEDARPGIFFDAMIIDGQQGLAFSDPIEGRLVLLSTNDAGRSWTLRAPQDCPETLPGEAGFAASGSCLASSGGRRWIGLGGETAEPSRARILRSFDAGATWSAARTPLRSGESRGVFSVVFLDAQRGIAVGGDYTDPEDTTDVVAVTKDGGQTWTIPASGPSGYRSCVACIPKSLICVAVGRNGADISTDAGQSWQRCGEEPYQAVAFSPTGRCGWAVSGQGKIARLHVSGQRTN